MSESNNAAPGIDLSCLARFTPILESGSAQMTYDASGDFVHFEVVRELLSHAGSPSTTLGVDLEPSRELRDKCQRIQENRDFWHGAAEKLREELFEAREELAKKIDARPKGGTPYDWKSDFFEANGAAVRAEGILIEVRDWFEAQAKLISKGCGSSWDLQQVRDMRDRCDAALQATSAEAKS